MPRPTPLINHRAGRADGESGRDARSAGVPFHSHHAAACILCGNVLTVGEQAVGKVCGRGECKTRHVREQAQAELRRQSALQERAAAAEQALVDSQAIPAANDRAHSVIPANRRRLTELPKRRVREFVDRLMGVLSQAAAVRFGNASLDSEPDLYDEPCGLTETQLAVLGNGCAVCRGHCCPQGSGHAFINVETIVRYMEQHPDQRPRDVLSAYVSRIGHRTYEDSCVYHAASGCTLPREMRSKVCNGYLCKGLTQILNQIDETPSPQVFVISVSDYEPNEANDQTHPTTRAALIDAHGVTSHSLPPATGGEADAVGDTPKR
ncbi:hypothetical protein Mal15_54790 [Stieleria maiorica]|uniref:Uncharacterized protein n=1 Tax=Stieleria maiorica TaxID=2795974 RepID=A0A5B9MJ52_9BACT|nr:hypothetical protein [Stieleria maiorica]QEG01403.1 hypothetical protein Mal15_54790 [Stieleria maiorica]